MNSPILVPLILAERNGSNVDCLLLPFFSFPVLSHVNKKHIRFYCLTNTGSKNRLGFKQGELISFGDPEFSSIFECFQFFLDYQSSDQDALIQVFAIEVPASFVDISVFSAINLEDLKNDQRTK